MSESKEWAKAQLEVSTVLDMVWADRCQREDEKREILSRLMKAQEHISRARESKDE